MEGTRFLPGPSKQCMDRFIFYSFVCFYLCAGILSSKASAMSTNRIEDQYLKWYCTTDVSSPVGSIDISRCLHTSLSRRHWTIRVPGSSKYTIYIDHALPPSNSLREMLPDTSESEDIDIINHDGINVMSWNGSSNATVLVVESNSITIVYRTSRIHSEHKISPPKFASLSYVATVSGSPKEELCSENVNQTIPDGYVTVINRSIGSTARVQCNNGYRLLTRHGHKEPVCLVNNGLLVWEYWPGRCVPVCTDPKPIEHGSVQVKDFGAKEGYEFYEKFNSSESMEKKMRHIISMATYSCDMPYVLEGDKRVVCRLNHKNKPGWRYTPMKCVIPSCNSPIILPEDTGAIVHPNYPHHITEAQPINCQWRITLKNPSTITFTFLYVDIPRCHESSTIFIATTSNSGPRTIATFTNTSVARESSFSVSASDDLLVTYQHSSSCHVTTEHRGFYIEYAIRSHQRIRREALTQDGQTNSNGGTTQHPLATSPPTRISPTSNTIKSGDESDSNTSPPWVSPTSNTIKSGDESDSSTSPPWVSPTSNTIKSGDESDSSTSPPWVSPTSNTIISGDDSDSNNSWKIAVGVIIPLIIIGVILYIVYKIYRKKFPVRMILGREFGKFRNPNYDRPKSGISLIRDDADDVFSRNAASSEHNLEFQTSEFKISYDNRGFDGEDEVDCENEEDRADREFRLKKSWLFRSQEGEGKSGSSDADEDIDETDDNKRKKKNKHVSDDKEFSDDSDIEAMLQEQQVTPRTRRKERSESDSMSSLSEHQPEEKNTENSSSHSVLISNNEETEPQDDTIQSSDEKSSFIEKLGPLFQQPTVEEVRAQMKARARSMSVDKPPPSPRPRSCSVQVDPSKSARRMSYNDSIDSRAKTDLLRFVHMQNITASVVGVAYLNPDGEISSSISSINSNDDDTSEGKVGQLSDVKIIITSDEPEMNDDTTHPETRHTTKHEDADETHEIEGESVETNLNSTTELSQTNRVDGYTSDNVFSDTDEEQGEDNENNELGLRNDDDVADLESSSGSSSSSDTHFEEHHVAMAKPIFSQQVSSVSASSCPTDVNPQEEIKDTIEKEIPNNGGVETYECEIPNQRNDDVTMSQTIMDNNDDDAGIVNVKVNHDHATPNAVETENSKSKRSDSGASDLERTESEESDDDVDITSFHKDTEPVTLQNLDYSSSKELYPLEASVDGHEPKPRPNVEDVQDDAAPPMDGLQTVGHRALETSGRESKSNEEKVDCENDENRKNDTERRLTVPIATEPSRETEVVRTDDVVTVDKKTIGYTPSPDDIESNSDSHSDSESISVISEHSAGDKEKVRSYNFEDRQRLSPLSLSSSEDSDTEIPSLSTNEKSREYRTGAGFNTDSALNSSDHSSSAAGSGNTLDRQLRVISGIEFSDASSDSSDVCQDDPPKMAEQNEEKSPRAHPVLKRMSFDANKFPSSFDNDSDVASDDDDDDDDDNEELNAITREDNKGTDVFHQEKTEGSLNLAAVTGSLLQRNRSSTGCSDDIDAYHEFTDDNIDNILLQAGDNLESTGPVDSNSNVNTQRTIGIDPDVKFSFTEESNKTKITFREEESDDDVDV